MSIRTRPSDYIRMLPLRAPEVFYSFEVSIDKGPWRKARKGDKPLLFDTKQSRNVGRRDLVSEYLASKRGETK
jgi:hypothetical protein